MTSTQITTLVLGLGNLLLGDDGVGVHAVQALQQEEPLPGIVLLDVGTAVLEAASYLETAGRVIVVDAVRAGHEPGSIYRFNLKDALSSPTIASMHGFDLPRVMALTRRKEPLEGIVIGMEPEIIDWSLELSTRLVSAFSRLLQAIRDEMAVT